MGTGSSISIDKSRRFYDPSDVRLFKCTPPLEICVWGSFFYGFPLMATTKNRIGLLEAAAADPHNNNKRNELMEAHNSGYCCKGWTSKTIENLVVAGALDEAVGGDARLGGLYASGKTLSVREVIVDDKSGPLARSLKAVFCQLCMNCNNTYVAHRAAERYLTPAPVRAPAEEVTAVLLQPEAVPRDLLL